MKTVFYDRLSDP